MFTKEKEIKSKVDHIIVGQGLAGSCLAIQLLKEGKKVLVFDEPEKNKASSVAAGLFNPITGKRMTKSWNAQLLFSYLFKFYSEAEELLGHAFFHPTPIYRPFISVEEQNEWMAISESQEIKNFVERIHLVSAFSKVNDPFGGITIRQSGYLNVNVFISSVRELLRHSDSFLAQKFDADLISHTDHCVEYEGYQASSIVFCNGLAATRNGLFKWLPIRPLKGETLSIQTTEKLEIIFNRGVYLVPTDKENTLIAGATYQPNDYSETITEKARIELEEKLRALINFPFTISHQNWGMRPTTLDRRPILGAHPNLKNIIIFNGLGTKGVSLAPYFSRVLTEWITCKSEIPSEVNIERFKALYSGLSSS